MKTLMINLPGNRKSLFGQMHLGIAYIASYLESHEIQSNIIDCSIYDYSMKNIIEDISKEAYDVIGLTAYYYNYKDIIRLAHEIKKKFPDIFLFMEGYLPSLNYKRMKDAFALIDCLIVGEGEITALNIVNNLRTGEWKKYPGIAYLEGNKIVYTGNAALVEDLNIFPPPKIMHYLDVMPIMTMRGCYGACTFCCANGFRNVCDGRYTRRRSPEHVTDEILDLVYHGVKKVQICDSTFEMVSPKAQQWFDKFADLLKEKNVNCEFECYFRVEDIINQNERIRTFMNIGLVHVFVGIESLIDEHLVYYNKGTTVEKNIQALHILDDMNLSYDIGFILFNPIITVNDVLQTAKTFKNINFNRNKWMIHKTTSNSVLAAFPGSPLYTVIEDSNLRDASKKGFRFIHSNVDMCFSLCRQWIQKIQEVYNYRDFYLELSNTQQYELIEKMKDIFYEAFSIDIDFLEELAQAIIAHPDRMESDHYYIIETQTQRLQPLIDSVKESCQAYKKNEWRCKDNE